MRLLARGDEVSEQLDVCGAFDRAPHAPIAGAAAVAMFNDEVQADLLFLGDIIAVHALDVFSKHFLLIPARSKDPQEFRDAFCYPRVGIFGPPQRIQMDEGGEWEIEVRTELHPERRVKLYFQEVGAHTRILRRRDGLARAIFSRLVEEGRFLGKRIFAEAQWRLNTLICGGGYPAGQIIFGPNPADLFGWGDKDEGLLFAQDTSPSGQFAQQWELRVMAREAASEGPTNGKLRRLPAYNKSCDRADARLGDSSLRYKSANKKSAPRRPGPGDDSGY